MGEMLQHIQHGMHYSNAFILDLLYTIFQGTFYFFLAFLQLKTITYLYELKGNLLKTLKYLQNTFLILTFICLSLSFPVLTGFQQLPLKISLTLSIILSSIPFLIIFNKKYQNSPKNKGNKTKIDLQTAKKLNENLENLINNSKNYWNHKKWAVIVMVFVVLFQWFVNYSLQDICVCLFNKQYGFSLFHDDYQISTRLTRQLFLKKGKVCKKGKLCHIYTTLGEDAARQMYIGVQGGIDIEEIQVSMCLLEKRSPRFSNEVEYHCIENEDKIVFNIGKKFVEGIEKKGQRNLFSQDVDNLIPNSHYNIKFYEASNNNNLLGQTNYKTLPENIHTGNNIKIAIGGDSGITQPALELIKQMRNIEPDVIFIGGDVSYDDGLRRCYYSWDSYLNMWENELFKPLNRTLPFVFALGNHDVGYNAQNGVEQHNEEPLIFEYFRFSDRNPFYYHHIIGNSIFFSLDTGYVVEASKQVEFIEQISKKYPNHNKFAQYHVPIYPVCFDNSDIWGNDKIAMDEMEKHWVPVFEKHQFMGCFENHGHQFKKTYPLIQRQIDLEKGVVYFGDGSMGLDPPYLCPDGYHMNKTQGIFENQEHYDSTHMWIVELQEKQVKFDAITPYGNYLVQNYTRNNTQQ